MLPSIGHPVVNRSRSHDVSLLPLPGHRVCTANLYEMKQRPRPQFCFNAWEENINDESLLPPGPWG